MLKDVAEKYYQSQNYNCAETIIHAANDYYDLQLSDHDMIMVAAFGAGMQTGNVCGAILSSICVMSMKYVEAKAHESKDIHPAVVLLTRKCKEGLGETMLCRDIKPKFFDKETRCWPTVSAACDVLEQAIADYEKQAGI